MTIAAWGVQKMGGESIPLEAFGRVSGLPCSGLHFFILEVILSIVVLVLVLLFLYSEEATCNCNSPLSGFSMENVRLFLQHS